MQYTLLFYLNQAEMAARSDPAKKDAFWASFMPYMQSVRDAGIFVTGAGLEPPEAARTIRRPSGKPVCLDGPYAETKEQLGGLFIIDVPDFETALEWAARYPPGNGSVIEVRPNLVRGA